MKSEDSTIKEGKCTFDVIFEAIKPEMEDEQVTMIINIESQNEYYPGYPLVKRGIYYGGRMLSSQYGTVFTDCDYEKVEKVYSVWICIDPPQYRKNTINRYFIQEAQVVGNAKVC